MGSLEVHHGSFTVSGSLVVVMDTSQYTSRYCYLIRKNGGALFYTLDSKEIESISNARYVTLHPPVQTKEDAMSRTENFQGPHSSVLIRILDGDRLGVQGERWVPVNTWHRLAFVP